MVMRSIVAVFVLSIVGASDASGQGLPQSVGEEVALGQSASGVPCRLRMTRDNKDNGSQVWAVMCEGWSNAAATLNSEPERRWKPETIVTESPWAKRLLDVTYDCAAAKPARLAGDIDALVRACKLKDGGWPGVMIGAGFGGKIHFASGAPDVMPQLDAALALAAGRPVAATSRNKQGLQDYNTKLLQATLGSDFQNIGLLDVTALRNFNRLTIELDNMRDHVGAEATALRWLDAVERRFGRDTAHAALPLTLLGHETARQGRIGDAQDYFRRADALVRQAPDPNTYPYHLVYKSSLALLLGDIAEAKRLAEESVEYRRQRLGQTKGAFLAHSLHRLAEVSAAAGDFAAAERVNREVLGHYQAQFGNVHFWPALKHRDIAALQVAQNKSREAEASAREAVRIFEIVHGQRTTTVDALTVLGEILVRNGRAEEGMASFRKAAQYAATYRDGRPQLRVSTLARYYNALVPADGKPIEGAQADELFAALQIPIDPTVGRSVTLMSARLAAGDAAVRDLVREHQEASRRVILLRSSLGRADSDEGEEAQGRQQQLGADIAAAEGQLTRLEQQMQAANPRYANLTNPAPLRAAELGRQLQPGEAVLQIVTGAQSTYVVVLRDGKAIARRAQISAGELQKRVDGLRAGVEWARRGQAPFDLAASHALYQLLVGPLDARLDGVKHLIVVLQGPLASLPPSLLVRRAPAAGDYGQAAWLMRDMALSVMPSISAIPELRANAGASRATQPFLGFGNPRFTGGGDAAQGLAQLGRACRPKDGRIDASLVRGLAPLPDTQDELKAIAVSLKAPPNTVVTGAAANLADLRKRDLSKVRILAFATHGLLPGDLPCQAEPALALTPGAKDDDGLLNASDIARLRLDADWVVLSACNTAGADGIARGGQALSGLVRAFLYAGSRAVLATHWDIASEPTVKLTTGTFQSFTSGAGRAEALRQSQLAMLGDPSTAHPVFWGAFVVVGEGAR